MSTISACPKVLKAVLAAGYTPTPSEQAIPYVLAGARLGIAQTRPSKTAAFVLPMDDPRKGARERSTPRADPRTDRELAAQVKENFDKYGVGELNVALLIGGVLPGTRRS